MLQLEMDNSVSSVELAVKLLSKHVHVSVEINELLPSDGTSIGKSGCETVTYRYIMQKLGSNGATQCGSISDALFLPRC